MLRIAASLAVFLCCVAAGPARRTEDALRVGGLPIELLAGNGSLWVLTCNRGCTRQGRHAVGRIVRIDPHDQRVTGSMRITRPGLAAVARGGVYVTDFWRDTVRRIDARSLR